MSKIKEKKKISNRNKFDIIDYKKNYKYLMIIPVLLFIISCFIIFITIKDEGSPIYRDVSLKGGLSLNLNIETQISTLEFMNNIQNNFKDNSFQISEITEKSQRVGFLIETDLDEDSLDLYLESIFNKNLESGVDYTSNFISPTLSNSFFKQAINILIISFVLMSSVIFFYFREFVPSFAVIISAIFDLIVTIGILNLFKIDLSIAGIGSLLMLLGYSIDTDILLTNRLIKERGDNYFEKSFFAFKTGILMTLTTLVAGIGAFILTNSNVIQEITLILIIGLLVDFVSTWVQNNGILLWWLESKN